MASLEGLDMLPAHEKDPFCVLCKCPEDLVRSYTEEEISAVDFALSFKPERANTIIEVTQG